MQAILDALTYRVNEAEERISDIEDKLMERKEAGIPGWHSSLAPAFGPWRHPGDRGLNPTSGSQCMEPASPSAYDSASVSLSL